MQFVTFIADEGGVFLEFFEVGGAEGAGFNREFTHLLKAFEKSRRFKGEFDFIVVEDLKNDHVVAAITEMLNAFDDVFRIIEEIADEDDEGAVVHLFGDFIKDRPGAGLLILRNGGEFIDDHAPLARIVARLDEVADFLIKDGKPRGILLVEGNVGKRRGDGGGMVEFPPASLVVRLPALGLFAGVGHRFGGIDEKHDLKVGFFLILFDEVPISAAKNFPVDISGVIALNVLPMLGKFDGKTLVRRPVHPRDESFNNQSRADIQRCNLGERFRLQIFAIISLLSGRCHDFSKSM